jgi:FtsP/CotA-like multicopper oxidase with cupredoxin domain
MDGVPHLIQAPIAPGGRFVYEFDAVDAGTFWYHPHMRSAEQTARGLYGPLIIEERELPRVDRGITWVLDDWRLARSAQITEDFGHFHDITHAGRIGNTVTINGAIPDTFKVRRGERIRLRLINAANARNFALDLGAHAPVIVALDGQPVEPHVPADGLVTLGPAMRVDLILDMMEPAGSRTAVIDRFYQGRDYRLVDFVYDEAPLRDTPPDWPLALPANPLAEPDLANAERHEVIFTGGAMGGMRGARVNGEWTDMRTMVRAGLAWAINGVAAHGHVMEPMVTLKRGTTHILAMRNDSAFHHPIHLHGHHFRVLSRNGAPVRYTPWHDTVLMAPENQVEVAFVADNPGDWMFHCHIPEHMEAGMMGVVRVT